MRFHASTRCIIVYLFMTIVVVHSQDIFDIFNDIKDQVADHVDHASAKLKDTVREQVLKLKDDAICPATHTTEYRTVLTAYRHVVKDWVEKFPSKDAQEYRLFLSLSPNEIKRLQKFATSSSYEQKDVLSEIHTITELIKRSVYRIEEDRPGANGLTWSAWLRSFDINGIIKTILVLIAIGAFSFISIRTHLRRGRWFTTFFIVAFIVSFIQNWYTLYQDAQAKVDQILMKKLPKHCQGQIMGILDIAKSYVGRFINLPHDECLEFHKALHATPHAQVTPFQALSMTFTQLFTTPLGAIGEGLSQFFAGTMRHIPMALWPIIIVLILIIFIIVILMYMRYEIHLPLMMGSIRPSPHAAVTHTHVVEQIENSSNQANESIQQLKDKVQQLQLELQQKKNLELEHNSTATARPSRPASIERTTQQQRERSLSSQRPNTGALVENDLRQRTTAPTSNIGFKPNVLPN